MPQWARIAIGLMVAFAAVMVFNSVRSGVVTLRGGDRIDRREQPIVFWALFAANILVALLLAGVAFPAGLGAL